MDTYLQLLMKQYLKMQVSLKVGRLPYAVGKLLFIPLINLWKKINVKMMMKSFISVFTHYSHSL